ncbi:PaaI family thioesterase [Streptomyces sp. NPDC002889]|uniref:PaaI family thioesterase n=1 Tax=Streptomyces sp. NPDC002889 TaxID=3364669 RepID=UPI00367C1BEE
MHETAIADRPRRGHGQGYQTMTGAVPQPSTVREYLLAIQAGAAEPPTAARLLGISIVEVGDRHAVFALVPRLEHLNGNSAVHGGFLATLADFVLVGAINHIAVTSTVATVALNVTYQRAVTLATGEIRAAGTVLHATERTATVEAKITDLAGQLHAHATATCVISHPPVPEPSR